MSTRRILCAYIAVMLLLLLSVYGTASATMNAAPYAEAVGRQSMYTLTVARSRGTVYDRDMEPLTNAEDMYIAAVIPDVDSVSRLYAATDGTKREEVRAALEAGKPFLIEVETPVQTDCIKTFAVKRRYSDPQPAANLIGYLTNGVGADGIEKSFDALLSSGSGAIDVTFAIDAVGGAISGAAMEIKNNYRSEKNGVVLTLDREIQIAVEAASSEMQKGAAVVLDTHTGAILASASFPAVHPDRLDRDLENEDAPFVNRALCGYAPGSVFKLFSAAAALEAGYDFREEYVCAGSIEVDGMQFSCYGGLPHGDVNMHTALRKSCNGYFIHLAQTLGAAPILQMLQKVGFGRAIELAEDFSTETGTLSDAYTLRNARALANFAFGQGETTVSPLQLAGAVNAIAAGGVYIKPYLYAGSADRNGTLIPAETPAGEKVMEATTANRLMAYMQSTARYGTARAGAPENCTSGIKTGTAQTGTYTEAGKEILNYWYAGYICDEKDTPKYTVVLLEETSGAGHTAEVFRKIGTFLRDFI